ncbi:vWA domain-containing protein [Planococcus sp. YIM B11945]|uniref:vWA domain-containing protein n=1 Tax=Planococcus sp. YIM B11945 TaxID=3435410 RepID=UPI003D7DC074
MSFSGWGLIWTAIMPLAVIWYYFFRKKYKDQRVSSTLFWREMMKEMQASPYLKKLQHHLLFYLQLAALLLCVFALLGPKVDSETLEGNEFIFVADLSATMLAGSPSHFEQQQQLMKTLASQAGGKPVTVVTTGARPEVALRKERDLETIEQVIDGLAISYEKAEIEKTLLFADTLVDNKSTVIHVFTDALDRSLLANKTGAVYEVHGFEEPMQNVSIRQFGLAETDKGLRAIVQVANESSEPATGKLVVTGGETEKTADIQLAAGEELLVPFEELADEKLWQAQLQVEDEYAADNEMAAFVQQTVNAVTIDSALHELVANGFRSLNMDVRLMESGQLAQISGMPIVTNQTELLAGAEPILLIGRNDEAPHEVSGEIATVPHALFAYANLEEVFVSEVYPPFEGYETVASIGEEPLIQVAPDGDIVVLVDIQSTDWPLNPSFPLFLWSAAGELGSTEAFLGFFQPNEQRSVALASESGEWEVFRNGEYLSSYLEGQGAFTAPTEPGVYDVVGDGASMTLIVQLSNEEKTLSTGSSYKLGQAETSEETVQFSLVPWLVLFVLVLVIAEWEVYRRGIARR